MFSACVYKYSQQGTRRKSYFTFITLNSRWMAVCWGSASTNDQDMEKKERHLGNLTHGKEKKNKLRFKYNAFYKQCEGYKVRQERKDKLCSSFHIEIGSKNKDT